MNTISGDELIGRLEKFTFDPKRPVIEFVYVIDTLRGKRLVGEADLKALLEEIEDDPEKYHSPFVLKWMNDDAMMCLATFIWEKLGVGEPPKESEESGLKREEKYE